MSDLPVPDPLELALSDPTPLRFTDVRQQEPADIPGLAMDVDAVGITAIGTDGTARWSAPWAEVAALATPGRTTVAGGGDAVVMTVHTRPSPDLPGAGYQAHRFVIPTTQPAAVEDTLSAAARYRGIAAVPGQQAGPTPGGRRPHFDALGPIGVAIPPIEVTEPGPGHTTAEPEQAATGTGPGPTAEEPPPAPSVDTPLPTVNTALPTVDTVWADGPLPAGPVLVAGADGPAAAGYTDEASPGWWVVGPAVLVTGAVVAVLLLAAGHVVHL